MPTRKPDYNSIIETLKGGNFFIECCNCSEEISLKRTALFDNQNFSEEALEIYNEHLEYIRSKKAELKRLKEQANTRSEIGAFATNVGFIMERVAPVSSNFPFRHNDCRSLFDPIDYIVFEGLSRSNEIEKIHFIDIKTGASQLSSKQKEIQQVVRNKKVRFQKF